MKIIAKTCKWIGLTLLSIVILLIITSTIRNRIGNVEIDAEINGLGTTIAIIKYGKSIKFTLCLNDKISCRLTANSLSKANLFTPSSYIKLPNGQRYGMSSKWVSFFADKGDKIKIQGSIHEKGISYEISGSTINLEYSNFLKRAFIFKQEGVQLDIQRKILIINNESQESIDKLLVKQRELFTSWKLAQLDYIKNNPNQILSTYFLSTFETDTIKKYGKLIKPDARNSKYWDKVKQEIKSNKIIAIGDLSPELNEKDINNMPVYLTDIKNKYVVLDFWGSWCAPCIRGLPQMKKYYEKYKEEIEFIGIACNDKENDLKKIINDYEINWIQILNKKNNDLSEKFEIESFPTKIVLNKGGVIIGIFRGEKPDFYQKIDKIMADLD